MSLRLVPGGWSDVAAHWFSQVPQAASMDDLRAQVAGGAVLLYVVDFDTAATVGAVLLNVESTSGGMPQGVVVVASARRDGVDLTAEVLPHIEASFRHGGVEEMRIHTARPGLIRKLMKQGYQPTEMVLIKRVTNG